MRGVRTKILGRATLIFFFVILVLTLTMIKKKARIKAISVLIRTHLIIKTAE